MALRSNFRVVGRTAAVTTAMRDTMHRRVNEATAHLVTATKETLSGPRSGRLYRVPSGARNGGRRRPGRGRWYRASAPGEAPASRTGALRNSIFQTPAGLVPGTVIVLASMGSRGLTPPYGRILETHRKPRLRRPFLLPTAEREFRRVEQIVSSGWRID